MPSGWECYPPPSEDGCTLEMSGSTGLIALPALSAEMDISPRSQPRWQSMNASGLPMPSLSPLDWSAMPTPAPRSAALESGNGPRRCVPLPAVSAPSKPHAGATQTTMSKRPTTFRPGNRAAAKPDSERRVSVSLRLPPDASAILRGRAASLGISQGEAAARALRGWAA